MSFTFQMEFELKSLHTEIEVEKPECAKLVTDVKILVQTLKDSHSSIK